MSNTEIARAPVARKQPILFLYRAAHIKREKSRQGTHDVHSHDHKVKMAVGIRDCDPRGEVWGSPVQLRESGMEVSELKTWGTICEEELLATVSCDW